MSSSPDATEVCAKQIAYLAGPMRGYAEYNFPAFHAAAAKLRAHGLDVWSPAEHDVNEDGFDPAKDTAQPMKHYMKRDLPAVLDADMVCVLPGWEKSQGACLEVHVAQACGIPVYAAETMQPIGTQRSEIAATPMREGSKAYQVAEMTGKPLFVPVCAAHAGSWFTERDHLKGGMDAECIVCAHASAASATRRSEGACPTCGLAQGTQTGPK